jgi:hypothetical protein
MVVSDDAVAASRCRGSAGRCRVYEVPIPYMRQYLE